ncbi:aldolase [Bacillus suaedae]|uniref:Aldolase n=1 Tax=Halalkalibacter suaedae TaxID=2822140 RepID=A0A940WTK4_9BACI|nr:aldolase [Bacillus suaedae]MBP3951503.1 aldolase [Bacillus suaedae]
MTEVKTYTAFGLHILSEITLPELVQTNQHVSRDIVIRENDLRSLWHELAQQNEYFHIQQDFILFHVPNVAIFQMKNGNEILVSPMSEADPDQVRLYILGTCMGAILLQRKILPLHGSAIMIDNKAYAIVGKSGAGKSTLASAFLNRGYYLLSDDVIPVTLTEHNTPIVTPAYPQQKLWLESLNQFGMKSDGYRPIIDRETKFAIPVSTQFADQPVQLAGVIELVKTDNNEIEFKPIRNLERLQTLFTHTYRKFFVTPAGLMEWHFDMTAKMVNKIEMYQLRRPEARFTAHELTDLILSTVSKEEKAL